MCWLCHVRSSQLGLDHAGPPAGGMPNVRPTLARTALARDLSAPSDTAEGRSAFDDLSAPANNDQTKSLKGRAG